MNINAAFQWEQQPKAEKLIQSFLQLALELNPAIAYFSDQLLKKTSTRLFDWLDYLVVPQTPQLLLELDESGFKKEGLLYSHPGAQLPRLKLIESNQLKVGLGVAVDSIADFLMVHSTKKHFEIEGSLFGSFRRCHFSTENGAVLWLIERRGTDSIEPSKEKSELIYSYHQALERWMIRPRGLKDEDAAIEDALALVNCLIKDIGQQRAAWTVLEGERRYWQSRNRAGQVQKSRQDALGMGWANHDHHTFRSSRRYFQKLVHLFELLGFKCRERFYAGEEAGWGAQVMENPISKLVLFLDVDLAPDEISQDFAHFPLPELPTLGTIGLWSALHGDSILKGGMHHLEAQFMFDELTNELKKEGVGMMNPFSDFPYLKQAFTQGELWQVDSERLSQLKNKGKITEEQYRRFLTHGAIGSHLENLQRREGYKGFNQKNVSIIIKETDPRIELLREE